MARLVLTHSTYVENLIPCLKRLATLPEIQTITPGIINQSKGRCPRLKLTISTSVIGGYKLIARNGRSVQEVFMVTKLDKEGLQIVINKCINK